MKKFVAFFIFLSLSSFVFNLNWEIITENNYIVLFRIKTTLFLLLSAFNMLFSQEVKTINYTIEDGLLSNEVYDLFEDKDGFIWIGTDKGVTRFDGHQMQSYTPSEGLADKNVLSIHQTSGGVIWFLSYNGRLSYLKKGKVYNENQDSSLGKIISKSYFSSFLEDHNKTLWFGTFYNGVFSLKPSGEVEHFTETNPIIVGSGLPSPERSLPVSYLFEDADSNVCFSNATGNFKYDGSRFNLISRFSFRQRRSRAFYLNGEIFTASMNRLFSSNINSGVHNWIISLNNTSQPNCVEYLSDSLLYVGTDNGLFSFHEDGSRADSLLMGKKVSDVIIDREGNLWISTLQSGLFLVKNKDMWHYNTNAVYSILNVGDSILFGGTDIELHTLIQGQLNHLRFDYKNAGSILGQERIRTLAMDDNKKIWFGSNWGLFNLEEGKLNRYLFFGIKDILFCDKNLFSISNDGTLLQLDNNALDSCILLYEANNDIAKTKANAAIITRNKAHSRRFYCLSKYSNDVFLAGTDKGILIYKDSTFHDFEYPVSGKIVDIKREHSANLWILDETYGLLYYHVGQRKLDTVEIFEDKIKASYKSLYLEADGSIWVASDKGVIQVNNQNGYFDVKPINTNTANLITDDINDLVVVNDTIWLASSVGIACLPKGNYRDTVPPIFFIDSMVAGEKCYQFSEQQTFTTTINSLAVYLTGISYRDQGELTFDYQLEGEYSLNTNTTERLILLNDLPPSSYILTIAAIDSDGNRSEAKAIRFSIQLLWWENWKVWLIFILAFLLLMGLGVRLLLKEKTRKIYSILRKQIPFLEKERFIQVKSVTEKGSTKIPLEELYYIAASGDYIEFFKKDKKVVVRATLMSIEEELDNETNFIRVHKSYIVNLTKVEVFKSGSLKVLDQDIPISRRKRGEVDELISTFMQKRQ